MANEYPGNIIPGPGYFKGNYANDDELLYSTARFTQKGVTLAAGQGVLPLGTVLAQDSTTKKYVKYASGGANGTNTPRGILRTSVDTGTDSTANSILGNIVISGILKLSKISAANSGTAGALIITGSRYDTVFDTFTF